MMHRKSVKAVRTVITLVTVVLLVLIAACAPTPKEVTPPTTAPPEEVTPPPTLPSGMGMIEIRVTDPGVVGVTSAIVTVENIEIHKVAGEEGEWVTIIEGPVTFDLAELAETEGEEILGTANITEGGFTGIRMDVIQVVGWTDEDPSREYQATVPSEKLKIVMPFKVEAGVKTILTLDFDLSKSLITRVIRGEENFLFKPVLKLKIEDKELPE